MTDSLLQLSGVTVIFRSRRGNPPLRAVDRVSLTVSRGEIVGLVGESGSGKSTLARVVVGLCEPVDGSGRFDGTPLTVRDRPAVLRRRIQMVFQDPYSSLDPRMSVRQQLAELLRVHRVVPRSQVESRCVDLLSQVHLPSELLRARPRQMSGGQRQRVAIARALAPAPELLVADEPVSALDVSVQAGIVRLFGELRRQLGLSVLFIAHDLAVVRHLCDRVAVMYMGRILEEGPTADVFNNPRHPYTQTLLHAIPTLKSAEIRPAPALSGEPPRLARVSSGCRFRDRCPYAEGVCGTSEPELLEVGNPGASAVHRSACHFSSTLPHGSRPVEQARR
jgi:oligopeptide transport system ATP-binding protein